MLEDADLKAAASFSTLSPEDARAVAALDFATGWGPVDEFGDIVDLRVGVSPVTVRIYRPAVGLRPAVVFAHGGGWVIGSVQTHDGSCRLLATLTGAVVVSVDYRLAPEHPFPAAADDVAEVLEWVFTHAAELGVDATRVSVVGDSAGGNLAAVAARRAIRAGLRPASLALVYPVTDTDPDTESYRAFAEGFGLTRADMLWYLGHYLPDEADRSDPDCAVLRADDLADLPPTWVATCEFDPLRDEGVAFVDKLGAVGVDVRHVQFKGTVHGFFHLRSVTEAATTVHEQIASFLRDTWFNGRARSRHATVRDPI